VSKKDALFPEREKKRGTSSQFEGGKALLSFSLKGEDGG